MADNKEKEFDAQDLAIIEKGRSAFNLLTTGHSEKTYFEICVELGGGNLSPQTLELLNGSKDLKEAAENLEAEAKVIKTTKGLFTIYQTMEIGGKFKERTNNIARLRSEIQVREENLLSGNYPENERKKLKNELDELKEQLDANYAELGKDTLDTIDAIGGYIPLVGQWISEMVDLAKQLIKEGAGIITQHKKEIADAMEFMRQHTTSQSKSKLEELKEKGKKLAEKDERIAKIMDSGILDYSEDKEKKEEVRENYTEYLKERAELKVMITELNRQLKEKALAEAKENNQEEFTYFVYSLEEGIKEVKETVDKASVATKVDPIVIDLNVDELLETTDVKNGVYFDMDNKGFKEKTAWISANDGLLVMDRNEDGLINSGAELFGDQNILMSGEVSSGGYMSLEELDEDKNLKIDAQDSKFNQIKVWRDKNQDGISTKDELFGLEELSIKAIHLENNVVNETDGNGNIIVRKGSYEKEDGSLGLMGEFLLSRNTIDSQISDHKKPELDNLQISEAIKSLPDIPSFGNVYSLRQAMALDQSGSLKNLVEIFVNDNNPITRNNLMDEILFLWAESKEIEPTSRGRFIDARKLATVEAFMGRNFTGVDGANPIREAAAFLNNAYDQLKENFYIQFLLQSEYKDLKQKLIPSYSLERGMTSLSAEDAIKFLEHKISRNPGQKRKYLSDMSRMMRVLNNNSPENYRDFRSKVIEKGFMELFELDKESFLSKEYTDADDRIDGVYDIVFSGAGNDTVYGNAKDNILHGGKGNDSLLGGEGSDIYYFNLGDGKDTITEVNNKQDKNIVIFGGGITKEDVTVRRVSLEDLEIKIKNTGDGIVIKKQVSDNPSIDALLFSNGETLKSSDISVASAIPTDEDDYLVLSESDDTVSLLQGNDVAYGKGGNDTIYGNEGDDQIIGGSGNDHLIGGTGNDLFLGEEGNDVYYYNIGDGADVIHDNAGLNVLVFGEGITKETIRLVRVDENDLDITFQNAEDKITVKTGVPNNVINKIKFADGTFLSNEEIKAISNRPTNLKDFLIGSAESDEIHALGGDDKILGKQGNDTLYGDDGDDLLHGNEGDDKLFGNQGKDILIGDDGNDILNGNEDDDKLYGAYGNDILYGMQGQDVLDGGFGDDILYGGEGDDILDADRHNDVLYGEGGNDTLKGGVGEDILDGGKGADTLDGGPGFDIFMFGMGSGQDTIQEYGDSVDKIKLTGTLKLQNLTFNRMEEDLVISIKGSDDTLTVKGQFVDVRHTIEEIEDSDGRKISFNEVLDLLNKQNGENLIQGAYTDDLLRGGEKGETIKGKAGNDQIFAEGGDDTVFGDDGDDYIVGGKGNDILNGGKGSDTFVFNRGDGKDQIIDLIGENSLRFGKGISKDSVKIFRMGTEDLKVNILGTEDEVILKNAVSKKVLNEIIFDDGTVLNYDEIQSSSREGSMFDDFLEGTENADEIYALGGDDTVYSGSGDDIVHGGEGNDKLYGQRGNDQLYGNEGNDVIHGAYDNDLIFGEQGNDVLLGNEGDDIVHGGDGDDTLYGDSEDSGERRHKISGNDTLVGGKGNDVLIGLLGDDEYIFARGEGSDTIQEELPWMEEQRNVISFKEGIAEDDLEFFRMNNDVVIRVFNSDKTGYDNEIAVKEGVQPSHSITTFKISEIRFSDGKKWNREIIEEKLKTIKGTDQDDELRGFEWRDTLIGGRGNDTYILDRESSPDTIIENPGESNIIRMSKEYTTKNVHPLRIGDDLTIQSFYSEYTGSSDASLSNVNPNYGHIVKGRYHIVKDYYKNEMPNIQKIVFADGTEWGNEKIDELAKHIYGTSSDDQVTGSDWNEIIYTSDGDDIIEGGKGDDVLDGSFGSDTYVFSRGDGEDIIENEKDYSNVEAIDTILFKGDIIKDDVKIRRDGNDLIVEVYAKDKISIDNKITIKDDFKYSNFRAIEKICFESGEELDKNEIYELAKYQYGTDGDDEIHLEHGDRIIEAGKGNDIINGSAGNTVYVFRLGDGRDTIQGEMEYVGLETTDTVLLKGDIRQELVKVKKKDYDLVIEVYSEDGKKLENEIIIKNEYLYTKPQIERVLFESDGSVWTSEQLKAKAAGMNGNPGNDNTGSDDNQGDAGEGNGNPGDHSNPPGNDNSQNPNEGMQDEEDGPDLVRGTENDDEIALQNGDFRVIGGRGDDKIVGSLGNSTYIFYRGDGKDTISGERDYSNYETIDTIRFKGDITEEDLTIRRTGRDLILEVRSKDKKRIDNKITVKDDFKYSNFRAIEKIEFSDGNFIEKQTIYERAHIIHGTSGDDEITLENGNFSVEAGRGNDIIAGSAGNTMYIFSRGDGEDVIKGEQDYSNLETIDTIKFKGDIVEDDIAIRKSGRDLIVEVYSKDKVSIDNKITVKDDFKYYNFRAIEKIEFGDGTVIDKKTIYERAESGGMSPANRFEEEMTTNLDLASVIENDTFVQKTTDQLFESLPDAPSQNGDFGGRRIALLVDSMNSFDLNHQVDWRNKAGQTQDINHSLGLDIWIKPD